jgi:hypothetical protein
LRHSGILPIAPLLRIHAPAAFGRPAHHKKRAAKAARFLLRDGSLAVVARTLALMLLEELLADADRLRRQFHQFVAINECR